MNEREPRAGKKPTRRQREPGREPGNWQPNLCDDLDRSNANYMVDKLEFFYLTWKFLQKLLYTIYILVGGYRQICQGNQQRVSQQLNTICISI